MNDTRLSERKILLPRPLPGYRERERRLVTSFALLLACVFLTGCGLNHGSKDSPNLTLVVRGASGDEEYAGLTKALAHADTFAEFFTWGAPRAVFVLNFQNDAIHRAAEKQLADKLITWRHDHPKGDLNIVGHSAGCGVVLGGLADSGSLHVDNVVLLAPSVSPTYPLAPALAHVDGKLHAFVSERDVVFLKYRTGTFGTYDNVRTPAAGNTGFASAQPSEKFVQHRYDPAWEALGNDGGHYGVISHDFVAKIIAPLIYP